MRHRTLCWSALGLLLFAPPLFGQEFTGHAAGVDEYAASGADRAQNAVVFLVDLGAAESTIYKLQ